MKTIACRFKDGDFDLINARAQANNRSFAEEARALMTWALKTAPKVGPDGKKGEY